jgi:hypothetical protein
MSEDYLKNQRTKSLTDLSKVSEAELHAENEGIKEAWQNIQDLKRKIATAKREAIEKIDAQFRIELADMEGNYALLLTLGR